MLSTKNQLEVHKYYPKINFLEGDFEKEGKP